MDSQKNKFSLPDGIHFLNAATFSPMSKAVEAAAHQAISAIANPISLKAADFFDYAQSVRADFSTLINAQDADRIALIPSASYGLSTVAANLHRKANLKAGDEILILDQEFPNDYYCFERIAKQLNLNIRTIQKPVGIKIGKTWNDSILNSISANTALLVVSQVHWIYGTIFDLESIAAKCKTMGTLLVIDATQSIGAMPFDIQAIQPEAVLAGSYKSLQGAYQVGFAYYGSFFDEGVPIEESWMNRLESDQFQKLMNYQPLYRPKAQRYNVGQFSNFTALPISGAAIKEILEWTPAGIEIYCKALLLPFIASFEALGCELEDDAFRAAHLFGISFKENSNISKIQEVLTKNNVIVAVRGNSIRVSLNVYNTPDDIRALFNALKIAQQ
jgi:selenocysteine lyase/cysteine desulfurase